MFHSILNCVYDDQKSLINKIWRCFKFICKNMLFWFDLYFWNLILIFVVVPLFFVLFRRFIFVFSWFIFELIYWIYPQRVFNHKHTFGRIHDMFEDPKWKNPSLVILACPSFSFWPWYFVVLFIQFNNSNNRPTFNFHVFRNTRADAFKINSRL